MYVGLLWIIGTDTEYIIGSAGIADVRSVYPDKLL